MQCKRQNVACNIQFNSDILNTSQGIKVKCFTEYLRDVKEISFSNKLLVCL